MNRKLMVIFVGLFLVLQTLLVVSANIEEGLISHYRFNNNYVDSHGSNDIKYSKNISFVEGIKNKAMFFGENSYADIGGGNLLRLDSYSISFWLKMEENNLEQTSALIYRRANDDWTQSNYIVFLDEGKVGMGHASINNTPELITSETKLEKGWNFVVVTYDSSEKIQKIYLNSELLISKNAEIPKKEGFQTLVFGRSQYQNETMDFQGSLDELRIYNKALDENTIKELYEEYEKDFCYWPPQADESNYVIKTPIDQWLFIDGYYEKRLICAEENNGVRWRAATSPEGWDGFIYKNIITGEENLQRKVWGMIVYPKLTLQFKPWRIVENSFWDMKWIKENGECYWPLGTLDHETGSNELLTVSGNQEERLLCYHSEWYKTNSEDFNYTSEQDVFPTQEGDEVGDWINENNKWIKPQDDEDDEKDDDDDTPGRGFLRFDECVPNWDCSGWSACTEGIQTRQCQDLNMCEIALNQPSERRGCVEEQTLQVREEEQGFFDLDLEENYLLWLGLLIALILIILIVILVNRR